MRPLPRDNDEIHTHGKKVWPQSEALTAEPTHTIAANGAPRPAGHDEPEARRLRRHRLRRKKKSEMLRPDTLAAFLLLNKFCMAS